MANRGNKKATAAQRRARKQAEKLANALYAAGKVPAAQPKSTTARRKQREERSREQKINWAWINMRPEDVSQMSNRNTKKLLSDLQSLAYKRYTLLLYQGTPNAATAIYETEFAFLNPDEMTINAMRAKIVALQKWLRRKDVSLKSAMSAQNKTLEYLREHGFPDVTAENLDDFFDSYARFLEYHGYGSRYMAGRIAAFTGVYAEYENPLDSMEEILERADEEVRREYERNNGADTFGGIELSPGGGVQYSNPPGIPTQGPQRARPSRPDRKQRRKIHAQQKARKSARVSARKKKQRKKR